MRLRALWPLMVMAAAAACADIALSPSTPASIEFDVLPAPAVVLGDTLRDVNGLAAPARATVRNQAGDTLKDAVVHYTYADASRDAAFAVDSLRGYIISLKALPVTNTFARISARAGTNLQAIRTVLVTTRPDSVDRAGATIVETLNTTLPDTGAAGVAANTSKGLSVTVRHVEGAAVSQVPNWLVKFEVVQPANLTNDSTANVFLVNEAAKASTTDTTDGSGIATRFVRVRASKFPGGSALDSAIVRVTVSYKGKSVAGSPVKIIVPIIKKATAIKQP
ncbi:MAG: hypothetical protein ABI852_10260 [Gemmatimonadaceae bacterium]